MDRFRQWIHDAYDLQNTFDLRSTALQGLNNKERHMADEKRNDQIVDSNELSEQDLEKATGGVHSAAALNREQGNRAEFTHENLRRR